VNFEHILDERVRIDHSNTLILLNILVEVVGDLLLEDLCQRYTSLLYLLQASDLGDCLLNPLDDLG